VEIFQGEDKEGVNSRKRAQIPSLGYSPSHMHGVVSLHLLTLIESDSQPAAPDGRIRPQGGAAAAEVDLKMGADHRCLERRKEGTRKLLLTRNNANAESEMKDLRRYLSWLAARWT
jgi:hypothetical protein